METEDKIVQQDALVQIHLRNEFYKRKYFLALAVWLLSLVVIIFLFGMLNYLVKHPNAQPLYFLADDVGRLIKDVPVNIPNMSDDDVLNWTKEAVEAANSYDFMNFPGELQNAQKYFTDFGWRKFMDGLRTSNNLIGVKDRKMVLIAKVVDKPKIIDRGILAGAYGYKIEMPVLVTNLVPPYDDKSSFKNALIVSVIVQRQKLLQSYKGLGILQMIGRLASSTGPAEISGNA